MEHDYPITKEKKAEKLAKSTRVKAQKHTHKTLELLMVLTTSKLVKLNMIWLNPNYSLRNVG